MQRSFVLFPALVFFTGALVYLNSLGNGFTFDDGPIVVNNPAVQTLDLKAIFTSPWWPGQPEVGLYRPLTVLTYALNYRLHGLAPYGYHLGNLGLHLLNGALLFWIALRVLGHAPSAGVAALAFVLHPVQTEAVNGVVGRAELLSAFWVLFAWVLYLGAAGAEGRAQRGLYWASLGAAFAGCFAKEHAVMVVGVLAVYDFLLVLRRGEARPFRRFLRHDALRYVPFALVVLLFVILRYAVVGAVLLPERPQMVDNPLAHMPAWTRVLTAVAIVGKYAGLLLFPYALSADYSYNQIPAVESAFDPRLWGGALVVAGVLSLIVLAVRRRIEPVWGIGPACMVVMFLPVSNLFFPIGTVMGERLLYLPMVGFCLGLGTAYHSCARFKAPAWALPAAAGLLLAIYGARTHLRNPDWRDNFTLFSSAVQVVPRSAKAHFNLGNALRDLGELPQALEAYQKALEVYPKYAEVHYNAGVIYQNIGQTDLALRAYSEALLADSLHVASWVNLGTLLGRRERYQSAVVAFERAKALDPDNLNVLFNYALACQELGRSEEAAAAYLKVLEAEPGNVDAAINLGELYREAGYVGETVAVYRRLLKVRPDAYRVAYNLGVLEERMGKLEMAAEAYAQASGSSGDMGDFALFRAGELYLKLGKKAEARRALEAFLTRWEGDPGQRLRAEQMLRELR